MVNPGAALKSTSSENGRSAAEKLLRMRVLRVGFRWFSGSWFRRSGHRDYLTGPIAHTSRLAVA